MNILDLFDNDKHEIEQDDLADKISVEAWREINKFVLMRQIIITRKQVGNEIKTVYRRSK